jgi:hypothetical protein
MINHLPQDCLYNIICLLDIMNIKSFLLTCKHHYQLGYNKHFWITKFTNDKVILYQSLTLPYEWIKEYQRSLYSTNMLKHIVKHQPKNYKLINAIIVVVKHDIDKLLKDLFDIVLTKEVIDIFIYFLSCSSQIIIYCHDDDGVCDTIYLHYQHTVLHYLIYKYPLVKIYNVHGQEYKLK